MKKFLCIEHGEIFTIEAPNIQQAREDASLWGAEVIEEIKTKRQFKFK